MTMFNLFTIFCWNLFNRLLDTYIILYGGFNRFKLWTKSIKMDNGPEIHVILLISIVIAERLFDSSLSFMYFKKLFGEQNVIYKKSCALAISRHH